MVNFRWLYRHCLETGEAVRKKQNLIRSDRHNVYTYEQNKLALDSSDDKRYIYQNGIDTLARGHYSLRGE